MKAPSRYARPRAAWPLAICLASLLSAPQAGAQQATARVTVQGIPYGTDAMLLPSTVTVLRRSDLTEAQPQVNLSEGLASVPGMMAANRYNYAQDQQISIRGFGSDAPFGVQGVYLSLDGIPLTMPDGQGQSQIIDLPTIGDIKVIKGPFATLYGNAAGGVIEAHTRASPDPASLSLRTWSGAFGSHQTSLVGGGRRGAWDGIAGLSRFGTDGWREHSAASRDHLNAALNWRPRPDDRLSLVVNALDQDAQDPAGLTAAELAQNPQQVDPAILKYDTRKTVHNRQTGLVWQHRIDPEDRLRLSAYGGTRRIVQFLPIPAFVKGAGGVVDLHDYFGGSTGRYIHDGVLAGRAYIAAAGVDYGRENEYRKGFANDLGVAGALSNDQYDTVDNFAQYLQASWQLNSRLSASGGLRHDQVRFNSVTEADSPFGIPGSGGARYDSTDPVVGLLYQLSQRSRIYADYGHGFVTPTFYQLAYRPDGQPGLNFGLQPMHLHNSEVGMRSKFGDARLDASVYDITTDNQIVVASTVSGRTAYMNAGRTRRTGSDLSLIAPLPGHLGVRLAYSLIDIRFVGGPNDGKVPAGIPRQQLYAGLTWRPPLETPALRGFYTSLSVVGHSRVFVTALNGAAASGYGALNWATGLEQRRGPWDLSEFLRIDNLLDRNYVAAVVVEDKNGRYFEAAPGRNAVIGVQLTRSY